MDKTKIIAAVTIGLIIIVVIAVVVINPFKPSAPAPVTLEFWSVFDNSDIYQPLILKYQQLYPNVTINYRKKNITSYENDLVGVGKSNGEKIFNYVPKERKLKTPLPRQ